MKYSLGESDFLLIPRLLVKIRQIAVCLAAVCTCPNKTKSTKSRANLNKEPVLSAEQADPASAERVGAQKQKQF